VSAIDDILNGISPAAMGYKDQAKAELDRLRKLAALVEVVERCPECKGMGEFGTGISRENKIDLTSDSGFPPPIVTSPNRKCPTCNGTGKVVKDGMLVRALEAVTRYLDPSRGGPYSGKVDYDICSNALAEARRVREREGQSKNQKGGRRCNIRR